MEVRELKHKLVTVENVRARREALGLTQGKIAERAGISRTTMSLIERGMPVSVQLARAVESVLQDAER